MTNATPTWREEYAGGSEDAERRLIEGYARDIRAIQDRTAAKTGKLPPDRTLHAKIIVGVQNAKLIVDTQLPRDLAVGYFQAGAEFPLSIRFSNASPFHLGDAGADMRGAALRVDIGDGDNTPIEDGATEWRESDSPFIDAAIVIIPAQDLQSAQAAAAKRTVDGFAFNPWNCPEPFRPLGGLNRARKRVYFASATGWLGTPPARPKLD